LKQFFDRKYCFYIQGGTRLEEAACRKEKLKKKSDGETVRQRRKQEQVREKRPEEGQSSL
jgi:hypothetical protein